MLAKTETETAKQIGVNKLKRLVKLKASTKKQCSEITGTFGDEVKSAVDKDNLQPVAFRMACQLDALSPEKLWHVLPALLFYIDCLGLEEKSKSAPPLPVEETDPDEE